MHSGTGSIGIAVLVPLSISISISIRKIDIMEQCLNVQQISNGKPYINYLKSNWAKSVASTANNLEGPFMHQSIFLLMLVKFI
jgi:hypothetical protein